MGERKKRLSWFAQGALSTILLGSYVHHFGDDFFSATAEEKRFEREVGIPVFINATEERSERSAIIRRLTQTYQEARENWDFFDEQFAPIVYIAVEELNSDFEVGWYNFPLHGLYVSCSEDARYCIEDDDFMHELGHTWYFSIPAAERQRLRAEWRAISSGEYQCSALTMLLGDCSFMKDCDPASHDLATVSCYATSHIIEDLAETIMFVYILNNPHRRLSGFPLPQPEFRDCDPQDEPLPTYGLRIIPETIPRIRGKIELLAEYGAFSARERDYALQQLDAYRRAPPERGSSE